MAVLLADQRADFFCHDSGIHGQPYTFRGPARRVPAGSSRAPERVHPCGQAAVFAYPSAGTRATASGCAAIFWQ